MSDLMNIQNIGDFPVSGRELYGRLRVDTPYHKWFPRMCEYGFEEGRDFNLDKNVRVQIEGEREVSREVTDHSMTLSMAKEICMLQRTDKGREVRRYLIQVEEAWNTPELLMARALQSADSTIKKLNGSIGELTAKIEQDKPKVLFADSVASSENDILIGNLAKILKQNGVEMGQNRLFEQLRKEGYLSSRKGEDWNMPTQKSMDLGIMRIKETTVTHASGRTVISKTTKVTGKGQVYFVNRYRGEMSA